MLLLVAFALPPTTALSEGKTWGKKEKDKIYITCRLAKRKIVLVQKICIYTEALIIPLTRYLLIGLNIVLVRYNAYMNQTKVYR